jgi:hypothetical protein
VTAARSTPAHAAATRRRAGSGTALTGHVAGMMPWGPLLAGCLTGIAVTVALRIFAGPTESPANLSVGIRASFVPVVAGLAFLLHDPHRQLTGALPARAWLTPAVRVAMALPVLALSGTIQLQITARALAADLSAPGRPAALPWIALTTELAAWCALALALAAGFERTRWHDMAGFLAAVSALAVVGALTLLPLHLLPTAITDMTGTQQRQWATAWRVWTAVGAAGILTADWAAGDPWRRARLPHGTQCRGGAAAPA